MLSTALLTEVSTGLFFPPLSDHKCYIFNVQIKEISFSSRRHCSLFFSGHFDSRFILVQSENTTSRGDPGGRTHLMDCVHRHYVGHGDDGSRLVTRRSASQEARPVRLKRRGVFFFSLLLFIIRSRSWHSVIFRAILLSCTFETQQAMSLSSVCGENTAILLWGEHILLRQKMENQKGEKKRKVVSVLSGIHHRDGGGMPGINLSHAFSVLLTFSPSSPKRRVVCQRAFIKADQRAKQCGGKKREKDKKKRRRQQLSAGTCRQVITGKVPLTAESSHVPPSPWDEETKRIHTGHQHGHDSQLFTCLLTLQQKYFAQVSILYLSLLVTNNLLLLFATFLRKWLFLTLEDQACYFSVDTNSVVWLKKKVDYILKVDNVRVATSNNGSEL